MDPNEDRDFEYLNQDYQRKKWYPKREKNVKSLVNQLLARKGFSQTIVNDEIGEAWQSVASKTILGDKVQIKTRTGTVRSGVLEIIVENSSIHQELMFQKRKLLKAIKAKLSSNQITDLRFRIGSVG